MRFLFLTVLLVVAASVMADDSDTPRVTDKADRADTLLYQPIENESSSAAVSNPVDLEQHLVQQPTVALFKSMVIPGWGQFGNGRRFKALLFASLETWFIGSAIHYGRQASDARELYDAADDITERNARYEFLDNKRKNRNKFLWFAGLAVFVSMFDAYVDAHLSGSPSDKRNEKFTFDIGPQADGRVAIELAFTSDPPATP